MRNRTGCEYCRKGHIKCVKVEGASKCQKCIENNRDCLLLQPFLFKEVKEISVKSKRGRIAKHLLHHDPSQVWVAIPETVSFEAVNDDLANTDDNDTEEDISNCMDALEDNPLCGNETYSSNQSFARGSLDLTSTPPASSLISQNKDLRRRTSNIEYNEGFNPPRPHAQSPLPRRTFPESPLHSPSQVTTITSPCLSTISSLTSWPLSNAREARLFHHYIHHVSEWIDICDAQKHFGKELPKRAFHYPVIANGIFAVAARSLSLLTETEDVESPKYLSECLKMMIATLNDPLAHLDEHFLAAMILMRIHEEVGDDDPRTHLFGSTKLLNSIALFADRGGLRESSSWVSLRQHIYSSLTTQSAFLVDLTNFRHSDDFQKSTDEAWANRVIFAFACILKFVFDPNNKEHVEEQWHELNDELEKHYQFKPWNFAPLWTDDTGNERDSKLWPKIYMSHPAHVIGMQYYHMAKMTLSIYDPRLSKLSFNSIALRKHSEREAVRHLRMIIGLAATNENVANAQFQASHCLQTCGSYLEDPIQQEAALELLSHIQKNIGWRTTHIVRNLKEQWGVLH